ncbi:Transporter [Vibrio crassostreae]|uniref:hypothetical protein n=1 Tax=Vibrio crassostreae TaxID=246167 RepID=UPI0005E1DA22|nr:hypothetical protein [Vibrio crassostreae]TCL18550.1 hypothetical protein EDB52_12028 [Vibrio crassostreae]TCT93868.1 hypothetical protein EDB47_1572 [Vibrio crassostreae]CAK1812557.1 Transporter [Vibrio crassostreae]CAK1941461.1 Transporter [Vibrio crassostreae]CAK1945276.1 Transporter [Vibrio crassostreae]
MPIRRQRGFLLMDVVMTYGVWVVAIAATLAVLLPKALTFTEAVQIDRTVVQLQEQSEAHYYQQVLTTRCLPQTALSLSDFPPLTPDGLAHYQVGYRQSAASNTPPIGIEVSVTLTRPHSLNTVAAYSAPERISPSKVLIYFAPLVVDLPDWAHWDTTTGCLK